MTLPIKVPMTVHGANKLRTELDKLKREIRPRIVKAIEEARAHGDLRENAEYHAAKEQQGMVEARIRDIEYKLSNANIIDISKLAVKDIVVFGTTVYLLNLDTEEKSVYQIVGDDEANIKEGRISINSPLSRAIIGKKVGTEVEVTTPGGIVAYEILQIDYI
ncbi:MAG: transcription elongation factor GreA [Gammaproteobacteria bacterium GWE2_37_16]|nr:MAG: transcription elongation factor GreA [Gammaproteobacteria bacterium GWE2_37_16]